MSCDIRSFAPRVPSRWRSSGGVASLLWKVQPCAPCWRTGAESGLWQCSRPRVSTPCKIPAYCHSASP